MKVIIGFFATLAAAQTEQICTKAFEEQKLACELLSGQEKAACLLNGTNANNMCVAMITGDYSTLKKGAPKKKVQEIDPGELVVPK